MTSTDLPTVQPTSTVRAIYDGRVCFHDMNGLYRLPPSLEPIFRASLEQRRDVRFTLDRAGTIHDAELLPPLPSRLDRSRTIAAQLWARLTGRRVQKS